MTPTSHEVTQLLLAWNEGDKQALDLIRTQLDALAGRGTAISAG